MKKKKQSGKNLLPAIKVRATPAELRSWTEYADLCGWDRNKWIRQRLNEAVFDRA